MKAFLIAAVGFFLSACSSVTVSPKTISAVAGREAEAEQAIGTWREAVAIANDFLVSEFNTALPQGALVLTETGMTFVTQTRSLPLEVRCNSAGDILLPFNMRAQERARGFVVGRVPPKRDRAIDNSFFKERSGQVMSAYHVASLILHELAHVHHELGTVTPWKSIAYYAEAILLFRYRNHSMERLPYRTTGEFHAFVRARFPTS